jgi:hypothetical protein
MGYFYKQRILAVPVAGASISMALSKQTTNLAINAGLRNNFEIIL